MRPLEIIFLAGGLIAFEETTGLLMSGKFFAAHRCDPDWAETNRGSTEEVLDIDDSETSQLHVMPYQLRALTKQDVAAPPTNLDHVV